MLGNNFKVKWKKIEKSDFVTFTKWAFDVIGLHGFYYMNWGSWQY